MAEVFGHDLGVVVKEGELVESVVVVLEVIGTNGQKRLELSNSKPMTMWQQYGIIRAASLVIEDGLRENWEDD